MDRFLQSLRKLFGVYQKPPALIEAEVISRYIFVKKHYSVEKQVVKYAAFKPSLKNPETSVYRIYDLDDSEIWDIGDNFVAPARGKTIIARGDLYISAVSALNLRVESSPDVHIRHANIKNWPVDESQLKLKAIELAKKARLVIKE